MCNLHSTELLQVQNCPSRRNNCYGTVVTICLKKLEVDKRHTQKIQLIDKKTTIVLKNAFIDFKNIKKYKIWQRLQNVKVS